MNFITAEQFLRQPKEIQNKLIKWWQPEVGDLYCCSNNNIFKAVDYDVLSTYELLGDLNSTIHCFNSLNDFIFPLLTEGQLIKFIEEKTNTKISINIGDIGYQIVLYKFIEGDVDEDNTLDFYKEYNELGTDLLEALWKTTIKIINN